jgi:protein-tyrosine phosphatase
MDLDQILPQLLTGGCPKTAEDIDSLGQEHDVTAVLCLQTDIELAQAEIDWNGLETRCRQASIEVRRVPVTGCDPDSFRKRLPDSVRALDGLLRDGHKVYVHCSLGVCRAPTVIVAYLHWIQDWEIAEALDYVTACRSCTPDLEALKRATEDWRQEPSPNLRLLPV